MLMQLTVNNYQHVVNLLFIALLFHLLNGEQTLAGLLSSDTGNDDSVTTHMWQHASMKCLWHWNHKIQWTWCFRSKHVQASNKIIFKHCVCAFDLNNVEGHTPSFCLSGLLGRYSRLAGSHNKNIWHNCTNWSRVCSGRMTF